ncbi:MAG TPA: hypothetical protein VKD91_21815, partial [Pyrinomonadaceae bacterium]|nr:hypothetical protein [Pyrinomonadaceae bacterium]
KSKSANKFTVNPTLLTKQIFFGAAGRSDVRLTGTAKYTPAASKNAVVSKGWTIASLEDGSQQAAPGLAAGQVVSYSESFQALQRAKEENPAKAKTLMLVRVAVTK